MKNIVVFWGFAVTITMALANLTRADEQPELTGTLGKLAQEDDRQILRIGNPALSNAVGFLTTCLVMRPHRFDPVQSPEMRNSTIAWSNGACLVRTLISYEYPPIFQKAGILDYRPFDYDRDGNLIVWRGVEEYSVYAADRNENLIKYLKHHVSPAGKILDTNSYTILTRYSVGDHNSLALFEQFRMATGRGFTGHLQRLTSEEALGVPPDRFALEALGSFGPGLRGAWKLAGEKKSCDLIREATFTPNGTGRPNVEVKNEGQMTCPGLTIAERGSFASGWYQGRFRTEAKYYVLTLKSITQSDFDSFQRQILDQLDAPLPEGQSEVIDRRGPLPKRIHAGGKPAP